MIDGIPNQFLYFYQKDIIASHDWGWFIQAIKIVILRMVLLLSFTTFIGI